VNWFVVVYKLILLGFIILVFSMLCGFSANWVCVCIGGLQRTFCMPKFRDLGLQRTFCMPKFRDF
jgi:hypothetical protein